MSTNNGGENYHLWNPFTDLEEVVPYLNFGPLTICRGEGPYVYNVNDKKFINASSSLWNVGVGHGRRELIEAATRQMEVLAYASCFRQVHPKAIEMADKLVEITDHHYDFVYLGSNGSEAVEAAIKMSRQFWRQSQDEAKKGKYKILSLKGSYHGVSYGAMTTSGDEGEKQKYGPLPEGFQQIAPPYCYRCPYGKQYPSCGLSCATELEETILREKPETVAAFIIEPIMGVRGIIDPPEDYFAKIGEICKKYDILLIADEVSTGFGRAGKLFLSSDWPVKPDILCLGKMISSGYLPLSAALATRRIYDNFRGKANKFDHGSTASGHPVCAAVGLANIDIILKEKLSENSAEVGSLLKARLMEIAQKSEIIGDVRGQGMMIGIELVKDKESKEPLGDEAMTEVFLDMVFRGLLPYMSGNVIAFYPPLIIDREIVEEIAGIVEKSVRNTSIASLSKKARLMAEFVKYSIGKKPMKKQV